MKAIVGDKQTKHFILTENVFPRMNNTWSNCNISVMMTYKDSAKEERR